MRSDSLPARLNKNTMRWAKTSSEPWDSHDQYLITCFDCRHIVNQTGKGNMECNRLWARVQFYSHILFVAFYISAFILHYVGDSSELHCASLLRTIFASLARAQERVHIHNIFIMLAFSKRLGLRETNHPFFPGNEYWDLTIFFIWFECRDNLFSIQWIWTNFYYRVRT